MHRTGRRAQPEVGRPLVLPEEPAAAVDLPDHPLGRVQQIGDDGDERPDRVVVGDLALEFDAQKPVVVHGVIAIQDRRRLVVDHDDVEVPVLVVIKMHQPTPLKPVGDARRVGDIGEHAIVVLPEERAVVGPPRAVVPVGRDQIEVPVVVGIEERRAPRPPRVAHARLLGHVGEHTPALVAVEPVPPAEAGGGLVRVGRDVRDEPVEVAVPVIIAERRTHAVEVGAHSSRNGPVGERAVPVVPEELAGVEVRSDRQVLQPVAVEVNEPGREAVGDHVPVHIQPGRRGHVGEEPRLLGAEVAEQPGLAHADRPPPVRRHQVEIPVRVVVAERRALPVAEHPVGQRRRPARPRVREEP